MESASEEFEEISDDALAHEREALGMAPADPEPPEPDQPEEEAGFVDSTEDDRMKFTHHDPALLAASESYEAGWQHWRKKEPVRAMQIGKPFVVDTLHGEQECEAGDYLVVNPLDGDAWGVKRQQFEASHERIG
jgi:hypothetical protein